MKKDKRGGKRKGAGRKSTGAEPTKVMRIPISHIKIEKLPVGSFGIDIQNYGADSQLIYMIDISEIDPKDIEGERLITRDLGTGNYKIQSIKKDKHETIVTLFKI